MPNQNPSKTDLKYKTLILSCLGQESWITTRNSQCKRSLWQRFTFDETPLVSLRRVAWKNALREWEWFMSGSDNINDLHESVRDWWRPWADKNGVVANNYGDQLRYFSGVVPRRTGTSPWTQVRLDQIQYLVDGVRDHPYSRRNVITTWNTAEMVDPSTPITNCHGTVIQVAVEPDNSIHLFTFQRSADVIVGVPHNWIQYWAFTLWLARVTGRRAGSMTWVGGDSHVYSSHKNLAHKIIDTTPTGTVPELLYTPPPNSDDAFRADDFTLDGDYCPAITERAEMVV